MTPIAKNFLKILKRKQPNEYTANELYDLGLDLITIYTYTTDGEDLDTLKFFFKKIHEYLNPLKRGCIINPGALDHIDKHRDKHGLYIPKLETV